jgi:hypothetical protein
MSIQVRQRLKDDFAFYASKCVHIRPKDGPVAVLTLNAPQSKLDAVLEAQWKATGRVRVIILKARQQGFSTYVHAWITHKITHQKAKKGLIVAHVADSTSALFDMYRRTYDNLPEAVKPSTKYSSKRQLTFPILDSALMVATAGGDTIARGETINYAHLSEVGLWPKTNAKELMAGLLAAVPNSKNTAVFIESTARGMSGPFYQAWQDAVAGRSDYIPFFSPWFDSPEYRIEPPADFERTYEEQDLVKLHGLNDGQLMFRRITIANTSRELFQQEYPSTPEEAFLTSGRPVFNPEQINTRLQEVEPPLCQMAMEGGTFVEHPRGELKVWHEKEDAETYYIGADVAMGIKNGDYSVAQVLDSEMRQVAVWRGHVHPDFFADILQALGIYYNQALICVENNNHGLLTAIRLGRDLAYPHVHTEVGEGQLMDKESFTIGFRTTQKTKPLIIDRLRAALRCGDLELNDAETLREMLSYIVTESGKMEAEEGCHDDCVMSLAMANHIHVGKFKPINVTDEYYAEAV